jgi:transcriptional regulator with PAS, ATPase and Fis domain
MSKFVSIITQNAKMREILETLKKVAESDYPVLLIGETGSELFALSILLLHSYFYLIG